MGLNPITAGIPSTIKILHFRVSLHFCSLDLKSGQVQFNLGVVTEGIRGVGVRRHLEDNGVSGPGLGQHELELSSKHMVNAEESSVVYGPSGDRFCCCDSDILLGGGEAIAEEGGGFGFRAFGSYLEGCFCPFCCGTGVRVGRGAFVVGLVAALTEGGAFGLALLLLGALLAPMLMEYGLGYCCWRGMFDA